MVAHPCDLGTREAEAKKQNKTKEFKISLGYTMFCFRKEERRKNDKAGAVEYSAEKKAHTSNEAFLQK